MFWIAAWLHRGAITFSIPDLLALDDAYPGLLADIDLCLWQVQLIEEQMKANSDGKHG